ncbi:type II secretion system minor pseudopilin GspK [Pseudomonas sp.]|uniref:type II secretion system minor pseudopilin GspK n=1 Tax=Pseudomonas sp. TaxID=306 RepID=UPI003242101B
MKRQRQQGVALITALLIVALAVTAAVGMAMRGQADIRRSSAVFERDLSREIALGAEKMVLQVLEQADGPDDLIWDTCLSPVLPFEVDQVQLQATLDDMRCRFNLNALAGGDERQQALFAQLVDRVGRDAGVSLPPGSQLALAVSDWMDPETDDAVYQLDKPPRLSANRTMLVASELNAVSGMTPEAWQALAPYVTAYPSDQSPIDLERSSELMQEIFADQGVGGDAPWFMRLQVVASFGERQFYQCTLLDAPNGKVVLREQTACEP